MLDPGQRQCHQPHENHQDTEHLRTNEGFASLILRHQVLENLIDRESETDQGRTGANPRHQRSLKSKPGAFEELLGDVSSQLFGVYDDDTVVYPGHGDDTTLGEERPHLEEWRERGW
jgi:hypothetical protein